MTTRSSTHQPRRAALAGFLGTAIEYYDFKIYGTVSALLFGQIFFTNLSPAIATIAALLTLAAGYVSRIAGALIFGHFGDRLGRKSVLMVTLVVMGISSGLIGLLPTEAQIGSSAAVLLLMLRLLQGFAVGGEYAGAVLLSSEHAPSNRRGLFASVPAIGQMTGSLMASGTMLVLTSMLSDGQLETWGWRVPFLLGFLLLSLAIYVRMRVGETPEFEEAAATKAVHRVPIAELFRSHPGTVIKGVGLQLAGFTGQGVFAIWLLSYAPTIGYDKSNAVLGLFLGTVLGIFTTPLFGALSDRIGRIPLILWGSIGTGALAFPMFWLINQGSVVILVLTMMLYISIWMNAIPSVLPALLSELFPTNIRFTAVSLTYQLGVMIGAGFGPAAAASLVAFGEGSTHLVSLLLIACAVISTVSALALRKTRGTTAKTTTPENCQATVV